LKKKKRWKQWAPGKTTVACLLLIPLAFAANHQKKESTSPQNESAKYIGSDTCKTCHEDLYTNKFERTPHFKTTLQDGHGCES